MSVYQIDVTTPASDRGRSDARTDMLRVQGSVTPNDSLMRMLNPEWVRGYLAEIAEFDMLPKDNQRQLLAHWERERTVKEA